MMATWKLAPALAAGCSVVLKPDPQTPLTALRLAELATEVGFPAGASTSSPAPGPTTGALPRPPSGRRQGRVHRLDEDGRRDHAARRRPAQAADLELGGKSPTSSSPTRTSTSAIPSSAWSIFYAAGQSCEARSRILVEQPLYDEFGPKFAELAGELKVGDPLDPETQMGSLVSHGAPRPRARLSSSGRGEGAEVVTGGKRVPTDRALLSADRARRGDERRRGRAGGDLRPGRHDHPVRGREGRDPDRQRRALRPDGDGLDGRSRARAPHRGAGSSRARSGSTCRTRRSPGSRSAATSSPGFGRELGLETLDLYLETKSVIVSTGARPSTPSGCSERALPVGGPCRRDAGAGELLGARDRASRARSHAARRVRPLAGTDRRLAGGGVGGGARQMLPWGIAADGSASGRARPRAWRLCRVPRRRCARPRLRVPRRPARARRRRRRERELRERPRGDALVRGRASRVSRSACVRPLCLLAGSSLLSSCLSSARRGMPRSGFLFFAALARRVRWSGRSSSAAATARSTSSRPATLAPTLRDGRLWRLALGSGIYVYAQIAIIGFGVVFLHDERGLSGGTRPS